MRFESPVAIVKAKTLLAELEQVYESSQDVGLENLLSAANELKWAIKALLVSKCNPLLLCRFLPLVDKMLLNASQTSAGNVHATVILLHCKSLLVTLQSPELVLPLIE